MLYDTLYDIAGDTSCSWRFYVFLVGSFLLSEISPLAPRIGWSESLKQENLKSGVFFLLSSFTWPWYTSRWPAGCLRKLQISHHIVYFCHALRKVILIFQVQFLVFHSMLFFILLSDENMTFQNFRLLSQTKILHFDQSDIQKNSQPVSIFLVEW